MGLKGDARTPVLIALILTMALVAMDTTILATAIPQVVGDLGEFNRVGWVFSIYLLAETVTIPIYGKLSDLHGRKPILLFGIVIFLIGSAASAAAWGMTALIVSRAVQGIGGAAISSTVNTIAGDIYTVEERGRIQGYLASVWGVSAVIAPALGGIFAQYLTWRWIFLVNIPLGIFAFILVARGLQESVTRREHRIDYAGALLILLAAGMFILGLLEGGSSWPWRSPQSLIIFSIAIAAAMALPAVERRAREPMLPPWVWRERRIAASAITSITAGMTVIGLSVYVPNWGQIVLGLAPVAAGFVLATMSITWPLTSSLSARLYLRIGFRDTALIGSLFALASGIGLSTLTANASVWQPVVYVGLMGVGMGLIFTPLMVGLQNTVGWQQRGTLTGALMYARFFGQSIGAAAFGAIANTMLERNSHQGEIMALHNSTHAIFLGVLVMAVITVVVLLNTPRHFPAYVEEVTEPISEESEKFEQNQNSKNEGTKIQVHQTSDQDAPKTLEIE